jgi:hypothetical protein
MSLYLCVFEGDEELDGVDVGAYSDYGCFLDTVRDELEGGREGARYPVLMLHSDCDGIWSPEACVPLEQELSDIARAFRAMPPRRPCAEWQAALFEARGASPQSLYDCFVNVDGEPLLERMSDLARLARSKALPILLQ